MKSRSIIPATLLVIVAGLWIGLKTISPPIENAQNKVVESATRHIPKADCGKAGLHEGCSHGLVSSYDPAILAKNEALTKKRLYTQLPDNQNSTKLIEAVNADSDWKGQIGGAIRAKQITISPKFLIKKPFKKGEILTLNLFDDVAIDAVVYESLPNPNETVITTARVVGTSFGRAVMAFTENELRVKVILPESNKIYEIHYNHVDGNHYVLELDPLLVDKNECGTVPGSPFVKQTEVASEEAKQLQESNPPPMVASDEGVALVVIDAMVVYADNVVTAAGSEANVKNIAAQGIALANDAHITTNTGMYINLVHTARLIGHTDTGNQDTDLNQVTNLSDGFIDIVHTWRDTYGADFVHMMSSGSGGLGWLPNFSSASSGQPESAFSVTGWASFASLTPAHEMGHNMNLHHSKFQESSAGTPAAPTGTDAAGWHWHPGADTAVAGHCSVMSYTAYTGEAGHAKVGLFSDPNIIHNGQPAGDINHGNAARVLRAYKNIYAAYRTRPLAGNSVLVESPNGGEILSRGQVVEIKWNSNTVVGNVKLELYKGGVFEREITAGTINDRIYYYTIPNDLPSSNLYKLRVSSVNNQAIEDFSDVNFTITQSIYATNLDVDPGFTITGGGWQYGVPGGDNPTFGGPSAAYTGTNIYDTNLMGTSSGTRYLTTPVIDCSNFQGVNLKFAGQFSVTSGYQANVEVSNNGTTWTQISSVSNTFVTTWSQYSYDISSVADGQSTVYLRWVLLSVTGGSVRSGMSVDDVAITGVVTATEPLIAASTNALSPTTLIGNSPANQTFTVRNAGIGTLNYTISDNQNWLSVSPSSGTSTGEEDTITVTYSTSGLVQGNYSATITVSDNAAGNSPVTIPVSLSITLPPIYFANMDTNPGWTFSHASWAYGVPTGGQQDVHGNPDPTSGYTGSNVIGYKLDGDYEASIVGTRWARTPAINCSNYQNVKLSFRRWLGVEGGYDNAYIQVSNDNANWTQVWKNSNTNGVNDDDDAWVLVEYDISAVADGRPNVYVRWGIGATDIEWNFCGWNLDDVKVDGDYVSTVTYHGNGSTGGSIPVDSNKYVVGAAVTVLGNTGNLVKTDKTFIGWNTEANGFGTTYSPAATFNINASTTLYAKWTTTLTNWASSNSLVGGNAAAGANPDGDILTNLQEFAFGTSPTSSILSSLAFNEGGEVTQAGIPVLRFATSKYHAVFARRKDHVAAGLTYTAQFSADLKAWTSSAVGLSVLTGAGSSELEAVSIEFPSTVPVDGGGAQQAPKFFRVGVQ